MDRIKSLAIAAKQKSAQVAAGVATLALSGAAMAQASGDPGLDAINGLGAKVTSYTGAALTVAVLAAGAWWGIAMMKKAFGKAK
ncbi:major coat protein [Cupriavidus sp. YAF13]|uniref:major coat protein n=1 Tax=Cupriavidus sp. YAF13 TaxID=3233075 RepID=UPI003F8E994A